MAVDVPHGATVPGRALRRRAHLQPLSHTLLAVPVREAYALVRSLTAQWEPAYDLGSAGDVHAHITVLGPFAPLDELPGLEADIVDALARVEPFAFVLDEVGVFAGDAVYLRPVPSAPFAELTALLFERFPTYPPYGGRFAEVIPHLSVGPIWSPAMQRSLVAAAEAAVPIEATATEVRLIVNDDRSFRTVARYGLGTA